MTDWNQNIPKELESRIEAWESQLYLLDTITIPRLHHFQNSSEIELHIFADASNLAYGTVAYYRIIPNFDIKVSFIITKSRLAPLKKKSITIPKLELQAALIASGLKVKMLDKTELNIKKNWTD